MDHATLLLPEFLVTLMALAILAFGRWRPQVAAPVATYGLIAALGLLVGQVLTGAFGGTAFADAVQVGPLAWFTRGAILLGGIASAVIAWSEPPHRPALRFGLLLLSVVGALGLALTADALILVLAGSLMALSVTGLLALDVKPATQEAALKRFLTQGLAGSFLLFGAAWLFGLGGSTRFAELASNLQTPDTLLTFGMLMLLGGLAFAVAAVPFHAWLPDASEASSPSTGVWLLGGAALATMTGLVRVLMMVFPTNTSLWAPYVTGLAVFSLLVGGLLALAQSNLLRLIGYSAVALGGMALVALVSASMAATAQEGLAAWLMTLVTAGVGLMGLIAGAGAVRAVTLEDLGGLHRRAPGVAIAMTLCALSLAALPFAGAFWARLTLLRSLLTYVSHSMQFGMIALAVLLMVVSVLLAYTALRIPKAIYLSGKTESSEGALELPIGHVTLLMLCAILSMMVFLAPAPLWALVTAATRGF